MAEKEGGGEGGSTSEVGANKNTTTSSGRFFSEEICTASALPPFCRGDANETDIVWAPAKPVQWSFTDASVPGRRGERVGRTFYEACERERLWSGRCGL